MESSRRILKLDLTGDDVRKLHAALGIFELQLPAAEGREARFGPGTHEAFRGLQQQCGLEPSGVVDPATTAAIENALDRKRDTVTGTVRSPDGAGVGGLHVVIVDRHIDRSVALAETHTDPVGRYEAHFSARRLAECHKAKPDLQAQVDAGTTLLATSATCYNATQHEVLDVRLPDNTAALPSERESLIAALDRLCVGNLADLHESSDRQDITSTACKA